jgi:hypothetical protein
MYWRWPLFPPGTTNVYTEILLLGSPCLCASISAQICPSESSCCIGKHLQEEPTYCTGQYSEGVFPSCNRKCMPASVSLFALHTTLCHILDFFRFFYHLWERKYVAHVDVNRKKNSWLLFCEFEQPTKLHNYKVLQPIDVPLIHLDVCDVVLLWKHQQIILAAEYFFLNL